MGNARSRIRKSATRKSVQHRASSLWKRQVQKTLTPTSAPIFPFAELPIELQLLCISFMELKALIASRGVCTQWRYHLLPFADISTPRRRLLALYLKMLKYPRFVKSREWIVDHLQLDFDRSAYVHALLKQYPTVPEEFRVWVMEWPARCAVNCIWPGLPLTECIMDEEETRSRKYGVNWLAREPEAIELSALVTRPCNYEGPPDDESPCFNMHEDGQPRFAPALLIWRQQWKGRRAEAPDGSLLPRTFGVVRHELRDEDTWLIFDNRSQPDCSGKVVLRKTFYQPPAKVGTDVMPHGSWDLEDYIPVKDMWDWIGYLEDEWSMFVRFHTQDPFQLHMEDWDVGDGGYKVVLGSHEQNELPVPPWPRREEEEFQQYLKSHSF